LSCGYKFGETRSEWASGNKKLAIDVFSNESHVFAAENIFTRECIAHFLKRGGYKLVTRDKAEIYLEGRIISISNRPLTRRLESAGHRLSSYDIAAKVEFKLYDKSGLLLWSTTVEDKSEFLGSANAIEIRQNKNDALKRLASEITKIAYTKLAEDF